MYYSWADKFLLRPFIVGVLFISIWYFVYHISDKPFLDGAMGNLFATIIGLVVGIPVALEINRRHQELQETNDQQKRKDEELIQKKKILKLVLKELKYNRDGLLKFKKEADSNKRPVSIPGQKDELWNAFSDGGELGWIKDMALLDIISTAYYYIRNTNNLEKKYFDYVHYPGMRIEQEKRSEDYVTEYLISTDKETLEQIGIAIKEIEKSIALDEVICVSR